jgi:hypothetical protein
MQRRLVSDRTRLLGWCLGSVSVCQPTTVGPFASLQVIDARKIHSGNAAILGAIPARRLSREMSATADGNTLVVVHTLSRQLQAIDMYRLHSTLKPLEHDASPCDPPDFLLPESLNSPKEIVRSHAVPALSLSNQGRRCP